MTKVFSCNFINKFKICATIFLFLSIIIFQNVLPDSASAVVGIEIRNSLWSLPCSTLDSMKGAPAIGADGTIYIGSDIALYAINADGSIKWQIAAPTTPDGDKLVCNVGAAIGSDGTVYYAGKDKSSLNGFLYAVNSATHVATCFCGVEMGFFSGSPVICSDGTIYAGTNYGKLYCFNSDGSTKWSMQPANFGGYSMYSYTVVSSDGTIYLGSDSGRFYAVNPDSSEKWVYPSVGMLSFIRGSTAIGSDGSIYFGSLGLLYALNADGSKKWIFPPGGGTGSVSSCPVIGSDGTVYLGGGDGCLYAVNPDTGATIWKTDCYETGDSGYSINGAPALGADGKIYVLSSDNSAHGRLYCLTADGDKSWYGEADGCKDSSPAIGCNGNVYVYGTKLYAFDAAAGGLAASAWPKLQKDRQNSGNYAGLGSYEISACSTQPDGVSVSVSGECDKAYDATDLASRFHTNGFSPSTDSMAFNATITSGSCGIFQFNSTRIPDGRVSDVTVMKLFDTNGTSMNIGSYAETGPEYVDGHWWMTDDSGNHLASSDKVTLGQNYYVYFVVQDNGIYDEDRTLGSITDPIVVGTGSSSGSSSGCTMNPNADFSLEWLLLALAAMLLLVKVKSRN